jgi:hypothetical protein
MPVESEFVAFRRFQVCMPVNRAAPLQLRATWVGTIGGAITKSAIHGSGMSWLATHLASPGFVNHAVGPGRAQGLISTEPSSQRLPTGEAERDRSPSGTREKIKARPCGHHGDRAWSPSLSECIGKCWEERLTHKIINHGPQKYVKWLGLTPAVCFNKFNDTVMAQK